MRSRPTIVTAEIDPDFSFYVDLAREALVTSARLAPEPRQGHRGRLHGAPATAWCAGASPASDPPAAARGAAGARSLQRVPGLLAAAGATLRGRVPRRALGLGLDAVRLDERFGRRSGVVRSRQHAGLRGAASHAPGLSLVSPARGRRGWAAPRRRARRRRARDR